MSWLESFQKLKESAATSSKSCESCGKAECECKEEGNGSIPLAFFGMGAFNGIPGEPKGIKKKEADASSSFGQFLRFPGKKKDVVPKSKPPKKAAQAPKGKKESGDGKRGRDNKPAETAKKESIKIKSSLKEGASGGGLSKFRAILIQEGLGNMKDCFFYTAAAIRGAASLFEGKKIYANHPDAVEEQIRPERKVEDILGYYENVKADTLDDGRTVLSADVCVPAGTDFDWARSLMEHSIDFAKQYPGRDLIGLSINAEGDSDEMPIDEFLTSYEVPKSALPKLNEARDRGMTSIKVVNAITSANSCDLVTEAGAGGRIVSAA